MILFSRILTTAVGCTTELSKFHSGQRQNIIPPPLLCRVQSKTESQPLHEVVRPASVKLTNHTIYRRNHECVDQLLCSSIRTYTAVLGVEE
jgi:hypothetical protein